MLADNDFRELFWGFPAALDGPLRHGGIAAGVPLPFE